MYSCIHMCIWKNTCINDRTHNSKYVLWQIRTYIPTNTHIKSMYIYIYTNTYVYIYIHTSLYIIISHIDWICCMNVAYTHKYIYICMYIYTYVYTWVIATAAARSFNNSDSILCFGSRWRWSQPSKTPQQATGDMQSEIGPINNTTYNGNPMPI